METKEKLSAWVDRIEGLKRTMKFEMVEFIKEWVKTYGEATNPLIRKISVNVMDWEITLDGNPRYDVTIDFLEYDPDTNKLWYLVLDSGGNAWVNRDITVDTHLDLLTKIFYHIVRYGN